MFVMTTACSCFERELTGQGSYCFPRSLTAWLRLTVIITTIRQRMQVERAGTLQERTVKVMSWLVGHLGQDWKQCRDQTLRVVIDASRVIVDAFTPRVVADAFNPSVVVDAFTP